MGDGSLYPTSSMMLSKRFGRLDSCQLRMGLGIMPPLVAIPKSSLKMRQSLSRISSSDLSDQCLPNPLRSARCLALSRARKKSSMIPSALSLPFSGSLSSIIRARLRARSSAPSSNSPPIPANDPLWLRAVFRSYRGSLSRDVSSSASHSKLNFFSVVRIRFFFAEKLDC